MIGGEGIARELILKAIANGKQVVTANKALLALHGNALFAAAAAGGVDLAFEASVGGCMPIIKTLRESLVADRIHTMTGILNGTCNYILTKITDDGSPFREALAEAQKNGFAEADPTLDVEGFDTAHKLALLTALAFGMEINYGDIYIEGISKITPQDIGFAADFGYRVKLLAIGKDRGSAVEARVHPTMIPEDNILSSVSGSLNAITVSADAVGDILLSGRGAGMLPTASAVLSDVVDIARNLVNGTTGRVPALSYQRDQIRRMPLLPIEELTTHYYFRFSALDRPGVLSKISGILGQPRDQPQIGPPEGAQDQRGGAHRHADPPGPGSRRQAGPGRNRFAGCGQRPPRGDPHRGDNETEGRAGRMICQPRPLPAPKETEAKAPCTSSAPTWKGFSSPKSGSTWPSKPASRPSN
jgi:homoserine dehydrogenase